MQGSVSYISGEGTNNDFSNLRCFFIIYNFTIQQAKTKKPKHRQKVEKLYDDIPQQTNGTQSNKK